MKVKIENLSSKDKQNLMNYVSVFNKLTEFQKLQENCDMLTFEDANKTNFYLINDNQFINYQLKKDNEKIYLIDQINNIYIQDACAIMPKFKPITFILSVSSQGDIK